MDLITFQPDSVATRKRLIKAIKAVMTENREVKNMEPPMDISDDEQTSSQDDQMSSQDSTSSQESMTSSGSDSSRRASFTKRKNRKKLSLKLSLSTDSGCYCSE